MQFQGHSSNPDQEEQPADNKGKGTEWVVRRKQKRIWSVWRNLFIKDSKNMLI